MAMIPRLRRFWQRLFPRTMSMPSRVIESDAPRIQDGVDYAQPVNLPHYLRQQLDARPGALREYVDTFANHGTYKFTFDPPGADFGLDLALQTSEDPLREWGYQTRLLVLSSCHSAYIRNPIAKRALYYMMAFTVGDGFNLNCKNADVEKVLNAFIDNPDNAIRDYERQAPIDLLTDGELFLRYFTGSGESSGQVVMAPLRPWEIQYIHTEPGFFRRPLYYRLQPYTQYNTQDPGDNEPVTASNIDAKDVQHLAINRMGYELRGRPELYAALPWLRAHKEWQENRARQNHWRGALLWWVKISTATQGVIAAKLAQYTKPPTPGSTVVTSDKEEWSALTNPVAAGDAADDGRQLKLMALNGLGGIPEYMTGDGENANLATTKSQQLPVLMTFRMLQSILTEQLWTPTFRRVIQANIDAGLLDEEVEQQDSLGNPVIDKKTGQTKTIKALDAFTVEYEPLNTQEPFTLAQALQIATTNGYASKQTASTEMGYDWTEEKDRIQDERQEDADAMAKGLMPFPGGAMTGDPTIQPPQDQQDKANGKPGDNANKKQTESVAFDEGLETDEQRKWFFANLGATNPGVGKVSEPVVMDFETYSAHHGISRQDIGDSALHRSSSNVSGSARKSQLDIQNQRDSEVIAKRDGLRAEYDAHVAAGRLRPPTHDEAMIRTAQGHDDNPQVQAARRVLSKRGVSWELNDPPTTKPKS